MICQRDSGTTKVTLGLWFGILVVKVAKGEIEVAYGSVEGLGST